MKLTLKPEAFNQELLSQIKPDHLNWSGDEHMNLVQAMVGHLKDENGAPISLAGTRIEQTMYLIFRPTEDLQRAVWKQAFVDAGYELGAEADRIFLLLLNSAQFAKFLSKNDNPATGKPYIVQEKKKGVKKDTFAALLKAGQPQASNTEVPAVPTSTETKTATEKSEDSVENVVSTGKVDVKPDTKPEGVTAV